jgi:hypothetical protein
MARNISSPAPVNRSEYTPVLCIRLTDYESPLLQGIDHRNQSAGVHIQFSRQVLLTDACRMAEQAKDTCVSRGELQGHQGFGELLRRAGAHLGEEKCDGGTRSVGLLTGHKL